MRTPQTVLLAAVLAVGGIAAAPGAAQAHAPTAPLTAAVTIEVFAATATCTGQREWQNLDAANHKNTATYALEGRLDSYVMGTFVVQCRVGRSGWTTSHGIPFWYAVTAGFGTDTFTHTNPFRICVHVEGTFSNWPLSNVPSYQEGTKCESS